METKTYEVSTVVNGETHKTSGDCSLPESTNGAVEAYGEENVVKLIRQAVKTNFENNLRASLKRELTGGQSRADKAENILSKMSPEEREALLAKFSN